MSGYETHRPKKGDSRGFTGQKEKTEKETDTAAGSRGFDLCAGVDTVFRTQGRTAAERVFRQASAVCTGAWDFCL